MKRHMKIAVMGIAASSLLAMGFSSTVAASPKTSESSKSVSTTQKGSLPKGKPFQYLNSRIDSLQAQLDLLIGRVNGLEDWQIKAQKALDKLELDVNKNATLITLLQGQIADINEILKTKQDIIDGECPANQYLYKVSPAEGLVCRTDVGSNGLAVLTVKNTADVAAAANADVNALCPAGSTPTGGAFNAAPALTVNSAGITQNGDGYTVNVSNSTAAPLPVSVTAICLAVNP